MVQVDVVLVQSQKQKSTRNPIYFSRQIGFLEKYASFILEIHWDWWVVPGSGTARQRSAVRRAMLGLHFCRAGTRRHVGQLYVRLYLQCCAALCCKKKSVKRIFFISSTLYVVPYPKKILSNKTNYQNSEKPRQYPKGAFISKLFASIVFCCWFPPLVLAYLPPSKFKLNFSVLKVETYAAEFLATGICREFPKVLQWLSGMYHLPKDDPVVCFVPFVLFFFFPFFFYASFDVDCCIKFQ
jgi:hypothetical protein